MSTHLRNIVSVLIKLGVPCSVWTYGTLRLVPRYREFWVIIKSHILPLHIMLELLIKTYLCDAPGVIVCGMSWHMPSNALHTLAVPISLHLCLTTCAVP